MKRIELAELKVNMKKISNIKNTKFAYAIAKNMKKVDVELNKILELKNPLPEIKAFNDERIIICHKHAELDENGKPIQDNGRFSIADQESFMKEISALRLKYKETLDNQIKREEKLRKISMEEVKIKFYKIKLDDCPSDFDANLLMGIEPILSDS